MTFKKSYNYSFYITSLLTRIDQSNNHLGLFGKTINALIVFFNFFLEFDCSIFFELGTVKTILFKINNTTHVKHIS